MTRLRFHLFAALLAVPASFLQAQTSTPPATTADAAAYASNPKYLEAMREGHEQLKIYNNDLALNAFNKANKISGGKSIPCLRGLYAAQIVDHDYKGAIVTASQLESLVDTPMARSSAEYDRAKALFFNGGKKPKPDQLQAIHSELQRALKDDPKSVAAMFLDGKVLTEMGKLDEARASFASCVSCVSPSDPGRLRAERFAKDPSLSLKPMAPAFEVKTLDGSRFDPDTMRDRVVLIDFWATWCGACNAELPLIKKIARDFAGEPLVILSISVDEDNAKWRQFIRTNQMTWQQYRDADQALLNAFKVDSIPAYFTIDADGILNSASVADDDGLEFKLRKLVAQAHEIRIHNERAAVPPEAQ